MKKNLNQTEIKQAILDYFRFDKPVKNIRFDTEVLPDENNTPVFNGCSVEFDKNSSPMALDVFDVQLIVRGYMSNQLGYHVKWNDEVDFRMSTRKVGDNIIPVFKGCSVEYQDLGIVVTPDAPYTNESAAESTAESVATNESAVEESSDDKSTTKSQPVTLIADMHKQEHIDNLRNVDNRDLYEMMRAHFDSHPTLPGEKAVKDRVNDLLDDYSITKQNMGISEDERASLVDNYVNTRIRQTPLKEGNQYFDFRNFDLSTLKRDIIDPHDLANKVSVPQTVLDGKVIVSNMNVELQKSESGNVYVLAELSDGTHRTVGSLPDKFLTNNPMNVDSCRANLQVADYSNGNMKNLSIRVVVDSDLMSGDVIELDEDMFAGLDQETGLEQ